ncbi:hypothetical protein C6N75_27345 [Streptomyces solincola]|uniref:Uncharacterized protein n=1 Tax=Streptomyces solincola TaxID=2100817 RepID=A0A2S9PNY9_9ACTN|nr:hypothetical protein [Streptomyces solincola]PRH76113.1 hypothetical protein C6N75_27345 [Streptomyces solincola]
MSDPRVTVVAPGRDLDAVGRKLAVAEVATPYTVPPELASVRAFGAAVAGLPWVPRERRVVPPAVEARQGALTEARRACTARRHVG